MPAIGAAAIPAAIPDNPPALAPVIPMVPPAPAIARILVERGWHEQRDGNFYFPGLAYPRIHIVLSADAANYDRNVSIYKDVKTIEVQGMRPGGGAFSHVFWLDKAKLRYDVILVNTALAMLGAEAKLVLQELLEE